MHTKSDKELIRNYHNFILKRVNSSTKRRPTFIGVGEGRCGTTSISSWLSKHPEVYMSPVKEVKYFSQTARFITNQGITFEEYLAYFSLAGNEKHVGEMSPQYLSSNKALKKMAEFLPELKVIVTIRNPIDRFVSLFKYHKEFHGIKRLNEYVLDAFEYLNETNRPFYCPSKNIKRSLYADGVESVFSLFGRENVLVLFYEELVEDSEYYKKRLVEFLCIDDNDEPFPSVNSSGSREIVPAYIEQQIYDYCKADIERLVGLGIDVPESYFKI